MISPDGDKVQIVVEPGLELLQTLEDFGLVLVPENPVSAQITLSPAEMGSL